MVEVSRPGEVKDYPAQTVARPRTKRKGEPDLVGRLLEPKANSFSSRR